MCIFTSYFHIVLSASGKDKRHCPGCRGSSFFCMGSPGQSGRSGIFLYCLIYAVGIQMEGYMRRRRSTEQLFAGSILINIIVYVFFAFIGQRVGFISEVPVGIGICILQVLSYLIEIHRGNVKAQKSILDFAVYIAMFPLFLAGPVVKYPQIRKELKTRKLSWQRPAKELLICMWFCKESYHCRLPGRFIHQDHVFEGRRVVCVWCMAGMCNLHVPDLLCVQWIL